MRPLKQPWDSSNETAPRRPWHELLRALREVRGITQEGWAARLGVSRKTVQRWESGERAPDPGAEATILAYCREAGLLRSFDRGPLAGLTLTEAGLRDLFAEARWRGVGKEAAPQLPIGTPPAAAAGPTNLPALLTSFVGREREMEVVRRVQAGTRLLTLAGAGGCGKTCLALQMAQDLLWAYPNGVWLVELAALSEAALVPQTVAAALGLSPAAHQSVTAVLIEALRPRHLLLVLDNCEHLLPTCAGLVESLLRACPGVEVLATSREPLGIDGETVWRVPPLSLPRPGPSVPSPTTGPHPPTPSPKLGRGGLPGVSDAERLFVERARQRQPEFTLTPANAAAVAEICRRLDGIPLAIELAAARVSVLSVDQIAARLDDCFGLLTGGSRTALPRHRTLRAAMDWSYDLLSAEEQICLRRLSVFAGGFSLDAAEVVCADGTTGESGALPVARDPLPAASGDVLDLLTRLVDKSLVIATDLTGAARYRFLETVRQYAAEKLAEAGEADAAHDRHLTWCTALAQAAEGSLCGPPTAGWLARLEQEHDNLRAVLRWSLDRGRGEAALCLAAALPRFWEMRGHLQEGRRWLMRALAAGEHAPTGVRAKGLQGAGVLAYMQGDYAAARALFAQSLDLYRDLGDGYGTADAQGNLGRTALRQGDYATARAFLEAALALHAEHGHTLGVANVQFTLGVLALRQGDYDAARARFATSLTLNRELGNTEGIANALEELATVLGEQGDDGRQAGPLLEESLALYRELGDRSGVAAVLGHLGMAAWARGEHARALVLLDEGLALYREVGDRRGIARLLGNQSLVALAQRDPARAAALCRESLALCREAGDTWAAARYLPIMAGAALALGRPERAARLFGAAAALRGRHGSSLPPVVRPAHDHAVAAARTALGDDVFTAVWGAGQSMPAEAVLDYALTDDDPV